MSQSMTEDDDLAIPEFLLVKNRVTATVTGTPQGVPVKPVVQERKRPWDMPISMTFEEYDDMVIKRAAAARVKYEAAKPVLAELNAKRKAEREAARELKAKVKKVKRFRK